MVLFKSTIPNRHVAARLIHQQVTSLATFLLFFFPFPFFFFSPPRDSKGSPGLPAVVDDKSGPPLETSASRPRFRVVRCSCRMLKVHSDDIQEGRDASSGLNENELSLLLAEHVRERGSATAHAMNRFVLTRTNWVSQSST